MSEKRGLKSLENWSKRVTIGYKDVHVTNMSTSFRDGLAFCAIIHHYFPDLLDFDSLSKENILHNNSLAFSTAEKKLGVPALLDAEDMVTYSVPDKLSIITYLSQLHNCFENQNRVTKIHKKLTLSQEQNLSKESVVSVPKPSIPRSHELCHVCQHRVFILERQIIAGKLYHRTCFRCSKCNSLLKPGAYIESDEKTGTYECAVCPRDEPKKLEDKFAAPEDMSQGVDSANESTPSVSPAVTPELPLLSSKLNAARNNFLRNNVSHELESEQNRELSVGSKSSSDESLNRETSGTQEQQNLDSGFKDGNISDDVPPEVSQPPKSSPEVPLKPMRQSSYLKSLSPEGLKTDHEHKPYQSVFTREILHTTSLSPLSRTSKLEGNVRNVSNFKVVSDIPLIRPFSYTPSSGLQSKPLGSELRKHSSTDKSELIDTYQKVIHRKSLDTFQNKESNWTSRESELKSPTSVKNLIQIFGEKETNSDSKPTQNAFNFDSQSPELEKTEESPDECDMSKSPVISELEIRPSATEDNCDSAANHEADNDISVELKLEVGTVKSDEIIDSELVKKSEDLESEKPDVTIAVCKEGTEKELYPDDLNPFGDDDNEEDEIPKEVSISSKLYPGSLNPFGDSDDDNNDQEVPARVKTSEYDESKNPFACDDDDEVCQEVIKTPTTRTTPPSRPPLPSTPRSIAATSSPTTPTGSLRGTLKKRKAPAAPPHVKELFLNTSSISQTSVISTPSPVKLSPSPRVHKNKRAPPPPPSPSLSNKSDSSSAKNSSEPKRKKRPAPPVPIPRRREIKKIPIAEIKSEMAEIEEKQMELERHGRELEVLIRDRDKEEDPTVEEEECIMQLFELVNEKNALFRRQAELMYIKRSQRLEEEQVELEFQIRCLMTKPASKRNDEDKKVEEKLLEQLLDVVDQRNEIVDTIEMDRLREAEEDTSIQEQMEVKNGELPITAEIKEKHKKNKDKKNKEKKKKKKSKEEHEEGHSTDTLKKGTLKKGKKWF